jgi:excisionase family DNA binding protein
LREGQDPGDALLSGPLDPDGNSEASRRADTVPAAVLTVPEAAKLLRVGRNSLYEAIRRGEVPHRRIGRKILLSRSALMGWLQGWSLQVPKEG